MLGWKGEDLSPKSDGAIQRFVVKASDKQNKTTPNEGALVKLHLKGKHEARVFDERDVEFNIGEGTDVNVVEGLEIAVEKMCKNEVSRIILKPQYAFGVNGSTEFNIPANATVEYEVTLKEFEREPESWKLNEEESVEQAKLFKDKGTKYLKDNKLKLAIKMYEKSNTYLSNNSSEFFVFLFYSNVWSSHHNGPRII